MDVAMPSEIPATIQLFSHEICFLVVNKQFTEFFEEHGTFQRRRQEQRCQSHLDGPVPPIAIAGALLKDDFEPVRLI